MKLTLIITTTWAIMSLIGCSEAGTAFVNDPYTTAFKKCKGLELKSVSSMDSIAPMACISCYKELIDSFPTETDPYNHLAMVYINFQYCDSALMVLHKGLKVDPENFDLLMQRCLVQTSLEIDFDQRDLVTLEKKASARSLREKKYDWHRDVAFLYAIKYSPKKAYAYIDDANIPEEEKRSVKQELKTAFSGDVHRYCGKQQWSD